MTDVIGWWRSWAIVSPGNYDVNYLTLECLGLSGEDKWAASWDCIVGDTCWYEPSCIGEYRYAARGESAPIAICRAAVRLCLIAGDGVQ